MNGICEGLETNKKEKEVIKQGDTICDINVDVWENSCKTFWASIHYLCMHEQADNNNASMLKFITNHVSTYDPLY